MIHNIMQLVGWIGNLMFAFSAVPQAYKCYRQGHAQGLSGGLLYMWLIGEISALSYGIYEQIPAPLIVNYVFNLLCLLIIMRYYLFERA